MRLTQRQRNEGRSKLPTNDKKDNPLRPVLCKICGHVGRQRMPQVRGGAAFVEAEESCPQLVSRPLYAAKPLTKPERH